MNAREIFTHLNLDIVQSSLEMFFAAVCLLNLVVGWGLQRSTAMPASRDNGGVPLIHGDDVGPLRVALKRRFPAKRERDSQPPMGDVGEIACGIPVARWVLGLAFVILKCHRTIPELKLTRLEVSEWLCLPPVQLKNKS